MPIILFFFFPTNDLFPKGNNNPIQTYWRSSSIYPIIRKEIEIKLKFVIIVNNGIYIQIWMVNWEKWKKKINNNE